MIVTLAAFHSACGGEHFSGLEFDAEAPPDVGQPTGSGGAGIAGGSGGGIPDATGSSGGTPGTGGMVVTTDAGSGGSAGGDAAMDSGGQMNDAPPGSHPATLTGAHLTTVAGSATDGTPNQDNCPDGQALIGFSGSLNQATVATAVNRQITAQCGVLAIDGTTVTIKPGATLPTRGGQAGMSPWVRTCPANQVVTGFSGRTGSLLDQLVFICAPLTASSAAVGTALMAGTETSLAPAGGSGGMAFNAIRCGAGEIGSGALVRSGTEIVGFALVCSKAAIAQ